MAAALLAALFAMGVFAPAGAEAGVYVGDKKPTVKLMKGDNEVATAYPSTATAAQLAMHKLEVQFEVSDTVDGMVGGTAGTDKVTIFVPTNSADTAHLFNLPQNLDSDGNPANLAHSADVSVTVKQGTKTISAVTAKYHDGETAADPTTTPPTVGPDANPFVANNQQGIMVQITGGLVANKRTTVTIGNITVHDNKAGTAEITVAQGIGDAASITMPKVRLVNTDAAPTKAEAKIDDDVATTLVVTFTTQTVTNNTNQIVIELPYDTESGDVTVVDSGGDSVPAEVSGKKITIGAAGANAIPIGEDITVNVFNLTTLKAGDEVTISQDATGYEEMLEIGGGPVTTDPTKRDTQDYAADIFGATAGVANNKADAGVALMFRANTVLTAGEDILGGEQISITLPKFHVPDTIDAAQIIIDGNLEDDINADTANDADNGGPENDDYYGPPSSVVVSGSGATRKLTLTLPFRMDDPAGDGTVRTVIEDSDTSSAVALNKRDDGKYNIVIKKEAGIRLPNSAGEQTVVVQDQDAAAANHKFPVKIISHISRLPTWVERGDEVTVTAKGINADGDATVHLLNMSNFKDVAVLKAYHDDTDEIKDIKMLEDAFKTLLNDDKTLDGEGLAVLPDLDRSLMDAGTAVLDFDTASSMFHAGAQNASGDTAVTSAKGTNILVVVDAGGTVTGHTRLGLKPTVTLDLTEVRRTGRMGVTVSDWYYGDLTDLRVNGIQVGLPDPADPDDTVDWEKQSPPTVTPLTVVVPRRARLGEMQVVVSGTTKVKQGTKSSLDKHSQTVQVGVFALTINPSTAVTDQVIRIEGSGYGASQCIVEIMVGDEHIREATTGDAVRVGNVPNCVLTDTDGTLSNSFKVPYNLSPGDYTVVARDALNRVGEGMITVPKPMIELDPEASQRGSTVTVIGVNFPAEDVVGVTYGGDPVTVATTDTVGKWRATFKIPVDATIGKAYEVMALSEKKATGQPMTVSGQQTVKLSAKATHTVPAETLKVWPLGQPEPPDGTEEVSAISSGGRLEVSATNLPPHTTVSLRIGNIAVAGRVLGEDAAADSAGRYTDSVLVPQLTPGTHTVELTVHTIGSDVVVVTFVDILDIITRPTADVFEDLITADQLTSVWKYDNATGVWTSYVPTNPAEINDLKLVSTNDIVWVNVTERIDDFQGRPLFAGWNLISLE